jgi:hypothetical protein
VVLDPADVQPWMGDTHAEMEWNVRYLLWSLDGGEPLTDKYSREWLGWWIRVFLRTLAADPTRRSWDKAAVLAERDYLLAMLDQLYEHQQSGVHRR